jgi:hypothetical protein
MTILRRAATGGRGGLRFADGGGPRGKQTQDETIRIEISEAIATLTVDRPEVKNGHDLETVRERRAALGGRDAAPAAGRRHRPGEMPDSHREMILDATQP